ncbi:GMC family oxidoreductase [Arenimonas alkanexedens]
MKSGDFDAVVVGAGAGGGAVAWRLVQRGLRVLLLDAGPAFDPATDYPLDQPNWERSHFPHKPGSQGQVRFAPMQALDPALDDLRSWNAVHGRLNRGEQRLPSGPGYYHVRGIGGSTLHYTGEAHRMNPHAMRLHSEHGVGADWPLDYAALEPYYLEAERLIGVAGPADPGDRWRSEPFPLPAHRLCRASALLGEGAKALGWQWQANARAALSQAYDGRPPCNYCGNCTRGCPRGDKGSADVTFIAKARASGRCVVRPDSTVVGFVVGGQGRIAAVDYRDAAGKSHRVETPQLVLAAGAIETPRLLLAHNAAHPTQAIGETSGQLGRNLLESTGWTSVGLAPEPLASFGGLPADAICWDFNRPDARDGVVGGFRLSAGVHEADLVGPIAYARRALPGWGRSHKQAMREAFGRGLAVSAIGEYLPNPASFVELDPEHRDVFGQPLARIHSHNDAMALRRLAEMARSCRLLLKAAGVDSLVEEYGTYDFYSAAHVFGTCRMGKDPATSVVDANLAVHGWENLLICDASVFPSSGGGEAPSLTIQALALRAADSLAPHSKGESP